MVRVRSCLLHYVYEGPHKDRNTMICVCVSEAFLFSSWFVDEKVLPRWRYGYLTWSAKLRERGGEEKKGDTACARTCVNH